MQIIGITVRTKKDDKGKDITSYVYHLAEKTSFGLKPFYDYWSRDCIVDAEIGSECEPILSTYQGQLKIIGLRLV